MFRGSLGPALLLLATFAAPAFAANPEIHQVSATATLTPDPALRAALMEAVAAADSFDDRFDAEVWLSDMSDRLARYVPKAFDDSKERLAFLRLLHSEAARAKVAPELVLAVIEIESRFDRFAVSNSGAMGYMQVMPFWLKEIGRPYDNLFKANTNLRMGCTILKYYIDRERGQLAPALRDYNGGTMRSGYVDKVLGALSFRWFRQ